MLIGRQRFQLISLCSFDCLKSWEPPTFNGMSDALTAEISHILLKNLVFFVLRLNYLGML